MQVGKAAYTASYATAAASRGSAARRTPQGKSWGEKNLCRTKKLRPTRLHHADTNIKMQRRGACVPCMKARGSTRPRRGRHEGKLRLARQG